MKKIFYFIASAIVALGAVACQNEIDENIDNNKQTEGVSFYAEVNDITRVNIGDKTDAGYPVIWEVDDALDVSWYDEVAEEPHFYFFVYDGEKFTCNEDGVETLNGKEVTVNYYASVNGFDSSKGKKGIMLGTNEAVTFTPGCTINMELQCAFFHFSSSENVVLTVEGGDDYAFYYNDELTASTPELTGEDIWVPFYVWAGTVAGTDLTLTASIDGEVVKQTTRNFANGKIYNLGTIEAPETLENWGIVGAHQGWATDNLDALYRVGNSNTYARYNMTFADGGFKFYGTTTEKVTIEHPAVTTGEEGDWYLQPNSNWKQANARFAVYFFGTSGNTWVSMKDDNGDGIYVANNPATGTYENMIFCRMNPANNTNNWDNKWNQTGDLKKPTNGNNCFSVPSGSWDGATTGWSKHTPEVKDAWTEVVDEVTAYWVGKESTDNITNWVTRWNNNGGNDNITVDTSKTYDVYFSLGEKQDWGFEIYYTILEHGSPAPTLK